MASFRGVYNFAIDDKGRVNIPARFRKDISHDAQETFVICRVHDGYLSAYPLDMWINFENILATLPQTDQNIKYNRQLRDTLTESKIDSQGRISLTKQQMDKVGIIKNVTLVGNIGSIEIWDTESYTRTLTIDNFGDLSRTVLAGLPIRP